MANRSIRVGWIRQPTQFVWLTGLLILLIVFFLAGPVMYAQSPWKWLNPKPQGNLLHDIYFINDSIGYACGEAGTVIKTTNGGQDWFLQPTPTNDVLLNVYFLNANIGFCGLWWNYASDRVFYLKTLDGGETWTQEVAQSDVSSNYYVSGIYFSSPDSGVIGTGGYFYVTADGGVTWTRVNRDHRGFQFHTPDVGYCVSGGAFKTTDGGYTWQYLPNSYFNGADVSFADESTGYVLMDAANGDSVACTTDGGLSWTYSAIGDLGSLSYSAISFANKDTGYVAAYKDGGSSFAAIRTTDGGQTWAPLAIPNIESSWALFFSVHAPSDNIAYVSGNGGYIWKTTDAGQTWVSQRQGADWLSRGMFVSATTGYGGMSDLSANPDNPRYAVMKTTNGGQTWFFTRYDTHIGQFSQAITVHALDADNVIVGADIYRMYRTTNGGQNWIEYYDESFWFPTDIDFVSPTEGFCVATQSIVKTTNAGMSWQVKHVHSAHTYTIDMVDSLTGYVSGSTHVLKTTDGGESWQTMSTGISAAIYDVSFLDSETGYAVGGFSFGDPAMVKTTDGGASWIDLTPYLTGSGFNMDRLKLADFVDENDGYIADIYGKIAHTTDGGFTWTDEQLTSNSLTNLEHLDAENRYAFGGYGTIIVRGDGWITGIKDDKERINNPKQLILHQNYPNPFNPSTVIGYDLPKESRVRLEIFNVLGQKVRTLVKARQSHGRHDVIWDGKDDLGRQVSSGVYLYRIQAGEFVRTRKMILVR